MPEHALKLVPTAAPAPQAKRDALKIVIVGHVDHGKSTLVGRLFHDTGSLPEGKYEAIKAMCERRGMPFEWAFLMDAMQAERDQGITIDTAQIWFRTEARDYVIIDAPGHKEFLKNMISGAAQSDAALLVIDANEGVREQSRRHGYLLHLLGIRQVAVAVNKMDLVGFDAARFAAISDEMRAYLGSIGVTPTFVIPVSARGGDNIAERSRAMGWYKGPTLVGALDAFQPERAPVELPLRLPIQDVYKFDDRRIFAGRIEAGRLKVGDTLVFSPSNKEVHVASIEHWGRGPAPTEAEAGQSVGITLGEQIFVERGEIASHLHHAPVETDVFRARLFWLSNEPMRVGMSYKLKLATLEVPVQVQAIDRIIDTGDLSTSEADEIRRNQVAEVVLRSRRLLALDAYESSARTGRFVLVDKYDIAGGGIISMEGYPDQRNLVTVHATNVTRVQSRVTAADHARRNGHKGGVIWLTGLSGAGKSTIAVELERRLHERGYSVFVLDGDNVRHGLCADLGFSPEERAENIRRVGEVAALMSQAGLLTLTAFISPYQSDRERARRAAGDGFHEIYVKADVAVCETRDPKGLYAKARRGEIPEFTGVSAPYEAPDAPEFTVDTAALPIEDSVQAVMGYIERTFRM